MPSEPATRKFPNADLFAAWMWRVLAGIRCDGFAGPPTSAGLRFWRSTVDPAGYSGFLGESCAVGGLGWLGWLCGVHTVPGFV